MPEVSLEELQKILNGIASQIDSLAKEIAKSAEGQWQLLEDEFEEEDKKLEEIKELEEEADTCSININTATKEELQELIGIGPAIAQKIINARSFSSVYDLIRVSGIGEITLQKIIAQGCAYVEGDTGPSSSSDSVSASGGNEGNSSSSSTQTQSQPQISLSYPEDNPVDREIEVTLSIVDLKNTTYDVKISIENGTTTLSEIYNETKNEWQLSYNYLKKVFSGKSFLRKFKLKIKDEYKDFRGQTDITAKIRDSNGKINLEFKGKINITNPEQETLISEEDEEEGETTDVEEATITPPSYPKILISEIQILPAGERFIELYNLNNEEINLTGWYIQRKTETGTSWTSLISSTEFEGKNIQPKSHFLIAKSSTLNLDILLENLTLTEDNVIILKNPNREIVDKVGWGEAQDFENAPAENPSSGKSIGRKWDENNQTYQDTDNNANDFALQPSTPENQNRSFSPAKLEVSPEVLEFSIDSPPKYLSISNSGEQTLNWQAVIQYVTPPVDGWLSIFPDSGQLSASETKRVEVSQYLASFPEGEYQAKIIVDAGQIKGSPKEIEVLLKAADDTSPRVSFNPLSSIQRQPIFTLSWQGEDVIPVTPIQDGVSFVSPSGINGFLLVHTSTPILDGVTAGLNGLQYFDFNLNQWKAWLEDKILFVRDTFLKLLGKDRWTYFFRIKAEDKAGNQSEEWVESDAVEVNLPKPILKVEPQSLEFEGIEFGSNPELEIFIISNIGDAPLEWEIEIYPEVNWLSLNPVFGQLLCKNDEDIPVSVDISNLSFGQYVIDLLVTSNGGSKQIEVVLKLEKDNVPPANADLALADSANESNFYTNNRIVKAVIANDQDASFWLLSENQVKPEADDLNWQNGKPSEFTLPEGDGSKRVYIWTKDKAGNISELGNSASIILDTTPPIARAEEDKIVGINQPITFDASGSSDNTEIASFKWDIDDSDGLNWENPDLAGETPVFTGYSEIGNYRVTLQVSDVVGHISADAFSVSVILPQPTLEVVINEIAWMGTAVNSADEWIELYNNTEESIDLLGWRLVSSDGKPDIFFLENSIISEFYLIERSDDQTTSEPADWIGSFGSGEGMGLGNNPDCEVLFLYNPNGNLVDRTVCLSDGNWPAGDNTTKQSMERIKSDQLGTNFSNWANNNLITRNGKDINGNKINGTPRAENSVSKAETQLSSLPFDEGFDEVALTFYGNPYIVQWAPFVPSGKKLIIEPGVVVKFKDTYSGLMVDGTLEAIGTEDKKIVFTSYQDEEYGGGGAEAGDWRQLYFSPESANSELDNVIVRYGGAYPDAMFPCNYRAAAIFVEESSIVIKNSVIEKNRRKGIYLVNSPSTIDSVNFRDHVVGCQGYADSYEKVGLNIEGGRPTVKNSFFRNNTIGVKVQLRAAPEIRDNIFEENEKPIYSHDSSPIFGSNQAANNNLNEILIGGSLTETATWPSFLPYAINGTLDIPQNVTLTLEPGVIVKSQNADSSITIRGSMRAIGTENQKIIFTSHDDENYGGDGGVFWDGLHFYSSGSVLENVVVRYGGRCHGVKYGGQCYYNFKLGAITLDDKDVDIALRNSIIEKNEYALYIRDNNDCSLLRELIAKFKSDNTIFRDNNADTYPTSC